MRSQALISAACLEHRQSAVRRHLVDGGAVGPCRQDASVLILGGDPHVRTCGCHEIVSRRVVVVYGEPENDLFTLKAISAKG